MQRPQSPEQDLQHPSVPRWVPVSCTVSVVPRLNSEFQQFHWVEFWLRAEVGCPPGRLYRECERGEGCPFSCAQVSGREGCYSDGCEEGCHCPQHTYQHHGVCLQVGPLFSEHFSVLIKAWLLRLNSYIETYNTKYQEVMIRVCIFLNTKWKKKKTFDTLWFCCVFQECPCLVDSEFLTSLQSVSVTPVSSLFIFNISEGTELQSGETLVHDCSTWWAEDNGGVSTLVRGYM